MRGLKPWDKTHYLNSENTQHPGCLFFFLGDDKLPSYIYIYGDYYNKPL